ncbi:MAG: hypothetical protein JWR26_1633 [Pedosphaera sp.]|nr:hypothetical protein [Pedosphaera sp.]
MKRRFTHFAILAGLLVGSLVLAHAQNYDISWYKIAGGGGSSTGGVYTVSGTIGQPDAGHLVGGSYTIDGGYWGIIAAVQTAGAPFLTITPTSPNVLVSWPAPSTGFNLQQNSDLSTTNWITVGQSILTTNGSNIVTVPASVGNKFFRLKK